MKVKLDENLPVEVIEGLSLPPADVATVQSEGLVGRPDPVILAAATAEGRVLVTLDVRLAGGASQARAHAGVILLRLRQQGRRSVTAALARAWPTLEALDLRGRVAVVTESTVRYRPR